MIAGLVAAAGAAIAYGVATVLQAIGSRRLAVRAGFDPRLLARLTRSAPYLAGLVLDVVGFVAQLLALRTLPLFLVQAAVAASVGVTALVAARWLGVRLVARELVALGALGVGLVLLGLSARPERGMAMPPVGGWVVLAVCLPVAGLLAAGSRRPDGAPFPLAVAAGLGFSGVGVAARSLVVPDPWWHLVASPLPWALAAYGLIAASAYAAALQRGSPTVVAAVTVAVETVVPAIVGIGVLGDHPRSGLAPVALAGFALTVSAALALAGRAEPVPPPEPVAPPERIDAD
jgi:drug/metabolite transporter (DMT)-like permease